MNLTCQYCNKVYASMSSRCNHIKKFHTKPDTLNTITIVNKKINCKYCNKEFNKNQSKSRHQLKYCKERDNFEKNNINKNYDKIILDKAKNLIIKLMKYSKIDSNIIIKISKELINIDESFDFDKSKSIKEKKLNYPINDHLINIILDKSKTIEILENKFNDNNKIIDNSNNKIIDNLKEINNESTLILNNIIITCRFKDNYINATQLCQAGQKNFKDWCKLNSTKKLIEEASIETGIKNKQLIKIRTSNSNEASWIHPDLVIQLSEWISPNFSIKVSKWIRNIFSNKNIKNDEYIKEIMIKDEKIQLLENCFMKKQKRKNYPEENVIYLLTTEDNKKKRIYIIGKAKNLKDRLSTYNKTSEHEVIYYKSCNNLEDMSTIENLTINKLKKFKEKANRDRFILPIDKNISFFIDTINNCIDFVNNNNKETIMKISDSLLNNEELSINKSEFITTNNKEIII